MSKTNEEMPVDERVSARQWANAIHDDDEGEGVDRAAPDDGEAKAIARERLVTEEKAAIAQRAVARSMLRASRLPAPKTVDELLDNIRKAHLKGDVLSRRLTELANQANTHHRGVENHWRETLEHARQAGMALVEAKRRLGHRTKWTKWRRTNFVASRETAIIYMRVARKWDDPRMVKARQDGIAIKSIRGFNDVLQGRKPAPLRPLPAPTIAEQNIQMLRREFAAKLRKLPEDELQFVADQHLDELGDALEVALGQAVWLAQGGDECREPNKERHLKALQARAAKRCLDAVKAYSRIELGVIAGGAGLSIMAGWRKVVQHAVCLIYEGPDYDGPAGYDYEAEAADEALTREVWARCRARNPKAG